MNDESRNRGLGSGLILIIAGLALVWMGTDLATGGALTRLVGGGAAAAAVAAATVQGGPRDAG